MKKLIIATFFIALLVGLNSCSNSSKAASVSASNNNGTTIYDYTMNDLYGNPVNLIDYKGKVVVIVNTASKCGLVNQLGEIEALYKAYKDKGVVVLGFPSNDFLGQEPLNGAEIETFCSQNYGVTFPLFEKIHVKGKEINPLYQYLTDEKINGVLDAPVSWNYQKFIIGKNGKVKYSFSPRVSVNDVEFTNALKKELE
ncbi:MAG: glutathione peroxidase [Chitinophagales bacterium]|nr:glutathione peroxidase [Chitinophagales bacterium]